MQKLIKPLLIITVCYGFFMAILGLYTLKNTNDINELKLKELKEQAIDLKAEFLQNRILEIEAKEEYIELRNENITPEVKTEPIKLNSEDIEQQIRDIAKETGFKWPDYLVKLAKCESSLRPNAINNKNNNPSWSKDRGLFQINDYWHSNVTDECAFDVECATKYTMDKINAGYQKLWTCNNIVLSIK